LFLNNFTFGFKVSGIYEITVIAYSLYRTSKTLNAGALLERCLLKHRLACFSENDLKERGGKKSGLLLY